MSSTRSITAFPSFSSIPTGGDHRRPARNPSRKFAKSNPVAKIALLTAGLAIGVSLVQHPTLAASARQLAGQYWAALPLGSALPKVAARADASNVPVAVAVGPELNPPPQGQQGGQTALARLVSLLQKAKAHLSSLPGYTGMLQKQERVDGELREVAEIEVKIRHEPFSVYLKWQGDDDQEVLYSAGQNNNKLLARLGGGKKFLPVLKLDPESSMAMLNERYPITQIGLLNLTSSLLEYRQRDLVRQSGVKTAQLPDLVFHGRACHHFVVTCDSPAVDSTYRKTVTYLDRESGLPLYVKCWGWPESADSNQNAAALDESTLLEAYAYTGLNFEQTLTDADFNYENPAYAFAR